MEDNFVCKAAQFADEPASNDGPFDVCLTCPRRGAGCSGPRTTAMPHERYVRWMWDLFVRWGGTRQQLSDETGVSKSTIDDFFAGRRKDISRITAGQLEAKLVGGDSKWPCPALLDPQKEIVYEDRPETLEALRINMDANQQKDAEIEALRRKIEQMQAEYNMELQRMKAERLSDRAEYREMVAHLRAQIDRKDDYIDRLVKKIGV